jgi:Polyketide cyclase / dehydrase and lipid transport/Protein of unknown function (DUF2934)
MGSTTHSIDVTAPLRAVYNQWTQFEDFPRFMEGVVEIRQHGPRTLFWRVNVGGKDKHWEAEILEQIPDTRIVWESIDGTQNRGMIAFEGLDPERTRITLTMEYEPEGFLERAGDALGIPSGQVEGDLNRFRDFIENRKMETGSWRGEIANGETINSIGLTRPDGATGVKNGSGMIEMEDREATPLITETGDATLSADERAIEEMPTDTILSLPAVESGSQSLQEPAPLSDERAIEEETQFYREAGVLAPTHEQIAERAHTLYITRGRTVGYALEDWLEAERQLSEEIRKP